MNIFFISKFFVPCFLTWRSQKQKKWNIAENPQYFPNKNVSVKHIVHVVMIYTECSIQYTWTNWIVNFERGFFIIYLTRILILFSKSWNKVFNFTALMKYYASLLYCPFLTVLFFNIVNFMCDQFFCTV